MFIIHHGNSNFALIDNFWDRLLGTYRSPDADDVESGVAIPAPDRWLGRSSQDSRGNTVSCMARAAAERAVD